MARNPPQSFCGYQFRFDHVRRTITIHKEDPARAMPVKYGAENSKPVETPVLVGAPPLMPLDGVAIDAPSSSKPNSWRISRG